jgi:hypothetical protein
MASPDSPETGPKPFVLVLMPFKKEFNDTYEYGIKGAAQDVGAFAERVDEQIFQEGILDRIFNQINKAEVIVADMTGQNPNVFYEVGYAHALNKVVVLLTQKAADIPFDIKDRQHITYGGQIKTLRPELARRLKWAIEEARQRKAAGSFRLVVCCDGVELPEASLGSAHPIIESPKSKITEGNLCIEIRNEGNKISDPISHIYLFTEEKLLPMTLISREKHFRAHEPDKSTVGLSRLVRLEFVPTSIPPGRIETLNVHYRLNVNRAKVYKDYKEVAKLTGVPEPGKVGFLDAKVLRFSLRVHLGASYFDFPFLFKIPETVFVPAHETI